MPYSAQWSSLIPGGKGPPRDEDTMNNQKMPDAMTGMSMVVDRYTGDHRPRSVADQASEILNHANRGRDADWKAVATALAAAVVALMKESLARDS